MGSFAWGMITGAIAVLIIVWVVNKYFKSKN